MELSRASSSTYKAVVTGGTASEDYLRPAAQAVAYPSFYVK
jgi:hypothetical protein